MPVRPRHTFSAFCLFALATFGGVASADIIVDTGETANPPGISLAITQTSWLAGEFTLDQAYTLSDIEGWFFQAGEDASVRISIYGDGGDVPDTHTRPFYTTFVGDGDDFDPIAGHYTASWQGLRGISWYLAPGSYWAAFEVRNSTSGSFYAPFPVPSPLSGYAGGNSGGWVEGDNAFGLRIQGSTGGEPVVPEPATATLCALGILKLAGRACRRRQEIDKTGYRR